MLWEASYLNAAPVSTVAEYDHLKEFFLQLRPSYEVLDIESDVDENCQSIDCVDCGKRVFNVNGEQGIHDDPKDDTFAGCGECAKKRSAA